MTRIDLATMLARPAARPGEREAEASAFGTEPAGRSAARGGDAVRALALALGNVLAHRHAQHGGDAASGAALREAAAAVCLADAAGHACWPLAELATAQHDAAVWRAWLGSSAMVAVQSGADAQTLASRPLVLDAQDRLYTQRYWRAECALAARWAQWQHDAPVTTDTAAARALLAALFPAGADGIDAQKTAVALALLRPALVLSGGPGTGKTTTVVRLLAALAALAPTLDVALVAPTGKAAARMQESLRDQRAGLPIDAAARARLPQGARTVHALLGIGVGGTRARHYRGNPLAADVVIVDEASMLGLMLAARLFDALKPGARIVLVGDRHQLASVESGIVLATLAQTQRYSAPVAQALAALGAPVPAALIDAQGAAHPAGAAHAGDEQHASDDRRSAAGAPAAALPARDAVVWLTHSHRFAGASGIGRVAAAIHAGDAPGVIAALGAHDDAQWRGAGSQAEIVAAALSGYAPFLDAVRMRAAPSEVLAAFDRHRVLCALRAGPRGAAGLNAAIADRVRLQLEASGQAAWYHGRPVIVTRNDPMLQVFNGDIGVCLADAHGRLLVHLRRADGSVRAVAPGRLDACEDAYALTVHKAQGSEFDTVDVVLPGQPSRVVVRELIYTAVTRARRGLRVWSPEEVLQAGVRDLTTRHSGLADRLREAMPR